MTRISALIPSLAAAVALLASCAEAPSKQTVGAGVGAVGGSLIGAQFGHGLGKVAATAVGGLIGGLLGASAGKSLDRADQETAEPPPHPAGGQPVTWNDPASARAGADCRDYQHSVAVDGREERSSGTACRQPDGSWAAVK
jgi:surface antigen